MRLSRWCLALFSGALAGRDAFESQVVGSPLASARRDAFESLVLFPVALAGRDAFESPVVRVGVLRHEVAV